jgi:hypothetical protein
VLEVATEVHATSVGADARNAQLTQLVAECPLGSLGGGRKERTVGRDGAHEAAISSTSLDPGST